MINIQIAMTEYYTKCVILGRMPKGEFDEAILVYSKTLGKVIISVKSVKKIGSKLSGHLNVGKMVEARIIKTNHYRLVDAISLKTEFNHEILRFLEFIKAMTPFESPDLHLWQGIEFTLVKGRLGSDDGILPEKIYRRFLGILGFGADFARCHDCNAANVSYFHPLMLVFLCSKSFEKLNIMDVEVVRV